MFSKFLRGQDESALQALELQWRLEYAKAQRKFKKNPQKGKKGRPTLGNLHLNVLNGKDSVDLSKIARSIATTREGRRLHAKVTGQQVKQKEAESDGKKVCVCFCLFVYFCCCLFLFLFLYIIFAYFVVACFFYIVCFFVCLSFCIILVFFFFFLYLQKRRGYKAWDADGLGEDKLVAALKLVLGDEPVSARQACRDVFGEGFPNVHRTLGNLYKKTFDGDSIGLARKLSRKVRQERLKQLDEEWITMGKPGNPQHVPYLTPDEEELVVSFLKTCNFMHMPFNRDAFKVSRYSLMHAHQSHTHISHAGSHLFDRASQRPPHRSGRV